MSIVQILTPEERGWMMCEEFGIKANKFMGLAKDAYILPKLNEVRNDMMGVSDQQSTSKGDGEAEDDNGYNDAEDDEGLYKETKIMMKRRNNTRRVKNDHSDDKGFDSDLRLY